MDFLATVDDNSSSILIATAAIGIINLLLWLLRSDLEQAVDFKVSLPEECRPGWTGKVLENPSLKVPGSTAVQCYCPATGQSLGLVNPATVDSVDRAIARAQADQPTWATTSFAERRRVLKTLLRFLLQHQDDIVTAACLDSGKTRVDALFGEILVTAEKLQWTIDHGEAALTTESRPTNFLMMYKKNSVRYEPLGVVAACVSWNYPFHNLIGPMISSLFTGNAIIVKNSEATAWSSIYFTAIVRGALTACGHSPNLVQSITCWPHVADHLTSHSAISHLTFIGSRPVAHAVCTSAAKALTPVVVELGGKDPSLILDSPSHKPLPSSETQRIASILMRGVFQSAGQNCIGIERIIAQPQAYTQLLAILEPRIRALRPGSALTEDNVDVGACISPAGFDKLESLIADAVSHGARLLAGGKRHHHPKYPHAHYFQPTLLVDVTPTMRIAQEELFAPVALLMRAESLPAALEIANSTSYGLGASVFGPTSSAQARENLRTCVAGIKAGMVAVNDFATTYAVQLPFGGVKGSGYGRFAGEEGLRGLCAVKSVCEDRLPGWVRTSIPPGLDYPMTEKGPGIGRGVVELGYGGWGQKIKGLRRIVGL
ncbi:ALDH-like protein [Myriangium duriaei CBS 260.36]|uniref:aldehyde dehydrogenase (NAD(+)) n=1 Tax=Myriangium duriaei CBS 260.36 TaxID=1168546 RepID=A0A9P4IT07_9PEZI|nr:ALDH-like protein [Myriangium duriaei CBS 260.36]